VVLYLCEGVDGGVFVIHEFVRVVGHLLVLCRTIVSGVDLRLVASHSLIARSMATCQHVLYQIFTTKNKVVDVAVIFLHADFVTIGTSH
jgi:hypothetical protein